MCKLIKKQIKRSMPLFLIFSLLTSTFAIGLVFNFDISLFGDDLLSKPEASAQLNDTASTTVTVLNAPPAITTDPAEVPPSASTTPRNVGDAISFTVTADDPESNAYYLIVCDADSVSPNDGGAPDCNGATQLCISGETPDETQASCTYSPIVDPLAETEDWYAFVCDNHSTEAVCSVASQGAVGDNSASPFYVNHAPSYTAISTYDDNKDPGNGGDPFVVRATTTDSDIAGEPDGQHLYVCLTDSWATTTGCAIELCHGVATSTDYVECSFATTTVAADGTWNYYAFVMDWHSFAGNNGNNRSSTYTVNNVAPVVGVVELHSSVDIVLNMKNSPEVFATTTSIDVSDANGCADIVDATSTIYWSGTSTAENCTADDNYCYRMSTTECAVVPGTCGVYPDSQVEIVCTTTMAYHALPTDNSGSNPNETTNWLAGLTAIDDDGARDTATSSLGVEVSSLEAIHIDESVIAYGSVRGGLNSSTTLATTTVVNYGNIPIDSNIEGTDMDKSDFTDTILVNNQKFDNLNFSYATLSFTLASTSVTLIDVDIDRPSSQASSSDEIYWGIQIPGGTTSGDYSGTNTFYAILDESSW